MTHFVGEGIEELAGNGVVRRQSGLGHLLRHGLLDVLEKLVAHAYDPLLVPGIDDSIASNRSEGQRAWQPENTENFLQFLERLSLLEPVINVLMLRVLGDDILDADAT